MDLKQSMDESERNSTNYTISGLLNSLNTNSDSLNVDAEDAECMTSKYGKL